MRLGTEVYDIYKTYFNQINRHDHKLHDLLYLNQGEYTIFSAVYWYTN